METKKVVGDVKKFVVDRATWYRGKGTDKSCLLNGANNKCCLGFYALECGIDPKVVRNLSSPGAAVALMLDNDNSTYDIFDKIITRPTKVVWKTKLVKSSCQNSATCYNLMLTNDNEKISDVEREQKIKSLFKRIGITVKFK